MAKKRGLVEIRLDRRQAFYAVVGSLLIVSVAFVVGLIMGQRMQVIEGVGLTSPGVAAEPENAAEPEATAAAAATAPDYTFYEELREEPPRPLLMPSRGGIGEPATAVRLLDREPPSPAGEAPNDAEQEPETAPESEPPAEPAPASPAQERTPEPAQIAAATPPPAPAQNEVAGARRLQRRTAPPVEAEPSRAEETGFFTVEAGRFPAFTEASGRRNQLRAQGHDAIVTIVAPSDGPREYRVQIGSYTRRADADDVAASIGQLGFRARVVQEG